MVTSVSSAYTLCRFRVPGRCPGCHQYVLLMSDWCNNSVTSTVVGMISTALRTGSPLPQITPVPLLDRFLRDHPGLNILQQEAAEEAGLPRTVTFDTLQDEQYMYVSSALVSRHGD